MNSPRLDRQNTHLDLNDPEVQAVIERYQDYDEVPYISPNAPLKNGSIKFPMAEKRSFLNAIWFVMKRTFCQAI